MSFCEELPNKRKVNKISKRVTLAENTTQIVIEENIKI